MIFSLISVLICSVCAKVSRSNVNVTKHVSRADELIIEYIEDCHIDPNNEFFNNLVFDSIEFSNHDLFTKSTISLYFDLGMRVERDQMNYSLLTWAARWDKVTELCELANLGADVNESLHHGITALHICATYGSVNVAQCLLELGCNIDARMSQGISALQLAIFYQQKEMINLLLNWGALVNKYESDYSTLHYIIEKGYFSLLKWTVEAEIFDLNIVKPKRLTVLEAAINTDNVEITRYLISKGAQFIIRNGVSALMYACDLGSLQMVKFFVEEANVDVNSKDSNGLTAFMRATERKYPLKITKYLFRKGISIEEVDQYGNTILILAARRGKNFLKLTQWLIDNGANLEHRGWLGYTALFSAVDNNEIESAEALLKGKSDPNVMTDLGDTPLTIATSNCHYKLVELLLKYKAKPNLPNSNRRTPLYYSFMRKRPDISDLLIKYGAIPE